MFNIYIATPQLKWKNTGLTGPASLYENITLCVHLLFNLIYMHIYIYNKIKSEVTNIYKI